MAAECKVPAPDDYRLTVSFDKEKYFLGENVLAHFSVENIGKKDFDVDSGSDYNSAPRHVRFKVTAVGPDGAVAEDPYPNPFCSGGIGGPGVVKPGDSFQRSIPLVRYCFFDKPGTYKISISHDLGWNLKDKMPKAVGQVTLLMPTAAEAIRVVDKMYKLPDAGQRSVSSRGEYQDFTALSYPVYLPTLLQRSQTSSLAKQALIGIASIATTEATRALIGLAHSKNAVIAFDAASLLCLRLPDPQWTGRLGRRDIFEDPRNLERLRLVKRSWNADLAPQVRAIARDLLTSADVSHIARGAFMLECIGTTDDVRALTRALDKALLQTKQMKLEEDVYPRPRGAVAELMRAGKILGENEGVVSSRPTSPGQAAMFLTAIGSNPKYRPSGWKEQYMRLFKSDIPYLRELTLVNLPLPPQFPVNQNITDLLLDKNVDVRIAACELIDRANLTDMKQPLLANVRQAKEDWHLRAAVNSSVKLGCFRQAVEIMVSRLDEPGMLEPMLQHLQGTVDGDQGAAFDREPAKNAGAKIKPFWQELLKNHGHVLQSGGRFKIGAPYLKADLFPDGYHFYLSDGKLWP